MKYTVSLKENRQFRWLYARGKNSATPHLALYTRKTKRPVSRLGITVSKKLGNAVVRNRVRRRLREIYRLNEDKLVPGYDLVVVARKRAVYARYDDLNRSFLQLAKRLHVLRQKECEDE